MAVTISEQISANTLLSLRERAMAVLCSVQQLRGETFKAKVTKSPESAINRVHAIVSRIFLCSYCDYAPMEQRN